MLPLAIVIYESARPQITILWCIPGTTAYRIVKHVSRDVPLSNVFIARIGTSMSFVNALFVKDMLLGCVADLADANRTGFFVPVIAPVVNVDSTALHVFEDVVSVFRGHGILVAFAMVVVCFTPLWAWVCADDVLSKLRHCVSG